MNHARWFAVSTLVLTSAAGLRVSGQSVVSTHSGLIYFFTGTVFLDEARLEQRFGRFPEVGEGRELRTGLGRAEVLLTPGAFLRLDENSSIRMIANQFADTRVELLTGSAILEVTENPKGTSAKLIYKDWQVRVLHEGTFRIDCAPPRIQSYKGDLEVALHAKSDPVTVREGEDLPLADVLVPETATNLGADDFKLWAMSRSQAISADNTVAQGIVDDPSQIDNSGMASGGYTYFPMTGIPSLDIGTPYGLSFWSPYQAMLSSIYFPAYLLYRPLYGGWPAGGWLGGTRLYPGRSPLPFPVRTNPPRTTAPRAPVTSAPAHVGVHIAPHH